MMRLKPKQPQQNIRFPVTFVSFVRSELLAGMKVYLHISTEAYTTMDIIIEETLSDEEIARFKQIHQESKEAGGETEVQARFQYAYALLKSHHKEDISRGIEILENLYNEGNRQSRRDYLYYVAIGHTRLKQYEQALDCINSFINSEPENRQAIHLRSEIKKRLTRDGVRGMALVSGAILVVGGLVSLGVALAKK